MFGFAYRFLKFLSQGDHEILPSNWSRSRTFVSVSRRETESRSVANKNDRRAFCAFHGIPEDGKPRADSFTARFAYVPQLLRITQVLAAIRITLNSFEKSRIFSEVLNLPNNRKFNI